MSDIQHDPEFCGIASGATGFKAAGFNWTGPSAASFTAWRFGETARFVNAAGLGDAACFDSLAVLTIWFALSP
jgi:hypothetical protein